MKMTMRSGEVGKRIAICKECPELNKLNFCRQCGCFMPAKVRIPQVSCPLLKWDSMNVEDSKDKIPVKDITEE